MLFEADNDYSSEVQMKEQGERKKFEPGALFYKIARAEQGKTKKGHMSISLDLQTYNIDTKEEDRVVKYVNFYPESSDFGKQQFGKYLATLGVSKLEKVSDLNGKNGVVILGWEQDWQNDEKKYPTPFNGGFDAWFSREKKSAVEIEQKKDYKDFERALERCEATPVKLNQNNHNKSQPLLTVEQFDERFDEEIVPKYDTVSKTVEVNTDDDIPF